MRRLFDLRFLAAAAIGLLLIQSNGFAQLKTWNDAGTDSWFDGNNWDPSGVPTTSNSVQINNGGTAQVMETGGQAQGLTIAQTAGTSGTLEILGAGVLTLPANDLNYIGYAGTGTVNISGGGKFNTYRGYLGVVTANSLGIANVDGSSSKWSLTNDLVVGRFGEGRLYLTNGGNVTVGHTVTMAQTAGTVGIVSINAATLNMNTGSQFQVGASGTGTLNVANGGILTADTGVVGIFTGAANSHATIDGTGSKWTNTGFLGVGYNVGGLLDIQNGAQVSDFDGYAGMFSGSNGTVNVTGANSKWTNNGPLYLGGNTTNAGGTGKLNVSSGGLVTVGTTLKVWNNGDFQQDNSSKIVVSSNTSTIPTFDGLYVGNYSGTGTLSIVGGGKAAATITEIDGDANTLVTVSGANSKLFSVTLIVGDSARGRLSVTAGGDVTALNIFIGAENSLLSKGIGVVDVDASTLHAYGNLLVVGNFGDGTLSVKNGGFVDGDSSDVSIGRASGFVYAGTGTAIVDGADSKMKTRNLLVGENSSGTLTISNGARVESTYGYVGRESGSVGHVIIDNATWVCTGGGHVGRGGSGTLELRNGGVAEGSGDIIIGSENGLLIGRGTARVPEISNGGTVSPGNSPGTLRIEGNYTQTATGRLQIELASTSSYDLLDVTGQVNLGGTLQITLLNGFTPAPTDTFQFLNAGSHIGAFSDVLVSTSSGGLGSFNVAFTATGMTLSNYQPLSGLAGDYNGDNKVDAADFVAWRNSSNPTQARYNLWRSNFGRTSGGIGSVNSAAVPEPAVLSAILIGLPVFVKRRRRARM